MAVTKFVFRENWVGSRWLVWKQLFFAIFDTTQIHILLPHKKPKYKEFSLYSIIFVNRLERLKTEALLLPILWH